MSADEKAQKELEERKRKLRLIKLGPVKTAPWPKTLRWGDVFLVESWPQWPQFPETSAADKIAFQQREHEE